MKNNVNTDFSGSLIYLRSNEFAEKRIKEICEYIEDLNQKFVFDQISGDRWLECFESSLTLLNNWKYHQKLLLICD